MSSGCPQSDMVKNDLSPLTIPLQVGKRTEGLKSTLTSNNKLRTHPRSYCQKNAPKYRGVFLFKTLDLFGNTYIRFNDYLSRGNCGTDSKGRKIIGRYRLYTS